MNTKKSNFYMAPNIMARDKGLSYSAKGLLNELISYGKKWNINVDWLINKYKGKKSEIRNGIKELVRAGYLTRKTLLNPDTKRFNGTQYITNWDKIEKLMSTAESQDTGGQNSELSKSPRLEKPELPDSSACNKEKGEINKTELFKQEQQQEEPADAAEGLIIDDFFLELIQDKEWLSGYLTESVGAGLLPAPNLNLLLFRFRDQSLKGEKSYKSINEVKKHFLHWFNLKKEKGHLGTCINEERNRQKKLKEQAGGCTKLIDGCIQMLNTQTFKNPAFVLSSRKRLVEVIGQLERLRSFIIDEENLEIIIQSVKDAQKLIAVIDRGEKAKKLEWFCQNAQSSN